MAQVIGYWKAHLHSFVPHPEDVHKSDYTQHARWMAALRELAPKNYETLLEKWRVDHHRRRNLWQAMSEMKLN
jgi:isochorismate hydrolase